MALANVTLNDTWWTWGIRINQLVGAVNDFESDLNLANVSISGTLTANLSNAQLDANSLTLISNSATLTVTPTNSGRLGSVIYFDMGALSTSVSDTATGNIASANSVNTVNEKATAGFAKGNAAYTAANSAYTHAASAFATANSGSSTAAAAYGTANDAYTTGNTAQTIAIAAFAKANTPNATQITTGVLQHEQGGLEADVSGYDGLVKITSGNTVAVTDNSSNWDTAFSWGNHANASYLNAATIGVTVQGYDANTVKSDETQTLTVGYKGQVFDNGTMNDSFFEFYPDPANGQYQQVTSNNSVVLYPPALNNGESATVCLYVINGIGASTMLFADEFYSVIGSYDVGIGNVFQFIIESANISSNLYSSLTIQQLV